MAQLIDAAESFQAVYQAYATINFSAFDYNTVKQSLLAYVQLYFPEDFNDYIESSEFIAILELFCYISELYAYRSDLNAHENLMPVAERQESVLRLASFISYTPTRNLPARGLVKLQSVTTTESVYDSLGNNLANVTINWNDSSNANWKEQFILVMNLVLTQTFGTVLPSQRVQVGDVLLELYTLNNSPLSSTSGAPVFSYNATANGTNYPMELVPVLLNSNGPYEKRPENNALFNLMYANDGLGDASTTTGFLMYTKQGTLLSTTTTFDGVTPNQTFDISVNNINDTDVWVNNVNPTTLDIITINPNPTTILSPNTSVYGYWYPVDTSGSQNIIFNYSSSNYNEYQVQSNANDDVTLIFGDGQMANIPLGTFEIWYRVSANDGAIIPATAVSGVSNSFSYVDSTNTTQTFTFAVFLTSSLLNASTSESIEHVRTTAPLVYETQNRMVNAQDYNTFMLQDPSILKMVAFNRTFAGDSKYIAWHDPSGTYENVKMFGDDLALYFQSVTPENGILEVVNTDVTPDVLLLNYIQPLLSSSSFFTTLAPIYNSLGGDPATLRTEFTAAEQTAILAVLGSPAQTIYFYYSVINDAWTTSTGASPNTPANAVYMMVVNKVYSGSIQTGWTIQYASTQMIAQSASSHFWNTNNGESVINYNTLNADQDEIILLQANVDNTGAGIFPQNYIYNVLSLVTDPLTPGLPNLTMLNVLPTDTNGDGIPENMAQVGILNYTETFTITASTPVNAGRYLITLPRSYILGYSSQDLVVTITDGTDGNTYTLTNDATQPYYYNETVQPPNVNAIVSYQIQVGGNIPADSDHIIGIGDTVTVTMIDYVYFSRPSVSDDYTPVLTTDTIKALWAANASTAPQLQTYIRYLGRYPFNFAWFHWPTTYYLVDPASSNIIDMYIITTGYYQALTEWLDGQTDVEPTPPSSLDLRTSYATLLQSAMISDTCVLYSGGFTLLFGPDADPTLQATFAVVRPTTNVTLTDNQVQNQIVAIIQDFFDPQYWNFGEIFEFQELATTIITQLTTAEVTSVVIVPSYAANQFGDLFEITPPPYQLFLPQVSTANINIVTALTPQVLRQAGY